MKKYILTLCLAIFSICLSTGYAQNRGTQDEFIGIIHIDDDPIAGDGNPCRTCENIPDIRFQFNNDLFNSALQNEINIRRAARERARRWYNEQTKVIERFIESKYNKSFTSFNTAKDFLFTDSETKNINRNLPTVKNKFGRLRDNSNRKGVTNLKSLKVLKIREAEIKAGNIIFSAYPEFKIGNTPLRSIKDLNTVNREYNRILSQFRSHKNQEFDHKQILKILAKPVGLENQVLRDKNNYYNGFNEWDRLDMIQFLIHFEEFKKYSRPPHTLNPSAQNIFNKYHSSIDRATTSFLENFAKKNKGNELSLFEDAYWSVIWKRDFKSNPFKVKDALNKHARLIDAELTRLLNSTPINANKSVDFLVSELKIINADQLKWLNNNASDAIEMQNMLNITRTNPNPNVYNSTKRNYTNRIADGGLVEKMIRDLKITDASQKKWLYENENEANDLRRFGDQNKVGGKISEVAKDYIRGQTQLGGLERTFKFKSSRGKLNNRNDQAYTHIARNGSYTMYQMEDGSKILESPNILILDKNGHFNVYGIENHNYKFHYIKFKGEEEWSRYLLKPVSSTKDELELMFILGAKAGAKTLGRYVLPIEDFKIIIDGKDFDGNQVARWKAAGGIILAVVPGAIIFKGGAKVLSAVSKIPRAKEFWYVVVREGNIVYTRIVRRIAEPTLNLFNKYGNNLKNLVDDALRSGEYTDDVIEEVAEFIEDLSTKKGRKFTWEEIKALFKRGNDFNRKARDNKWYKFNEIHLANGKRLDSYNDVLKEIVSRKATDLGKIKFATFEKYLKEFVSKYKVGTKIRSNKYLKELDGKLLEGTYILEIPLSNKSLTNIQTFIDYAWKHYKVKIRFRPL